MTEACEVSIIDRPKARKDHVCDECHGTIPKGEIYALHHGVFDGAGFSHKMCIDCEKLIDEINQGHPFEETVWNGGLCEFASEEGDETLRRYADIKKKRGATILPWITNRLNNPDL